MLQILITSIKTELNNLIDEIRITEFFGRIDALQNTNKVEVKGIPLLNQLRMEFAYGGVKYDYYDRLKAWVSINIVIVFIPKVMAQIQNQTDFVRKSKI